jgi:hypothetical protein
MKSVLLPCFLALSSLMALAAPPQYSPRKDIVTGLRSVTSECLAVADFNSDGRLDFVVADARGKNIQVYLNDGRGNFSAPVITEPLDPTLTQAPLVVGDFNEDGKPDLIVSPFPIESGPYVQKAIFYSGNGDGTFTQRSIISGLSWSFAAIAADANQDSHLDLISSANPTKIAFGDGHGSFSVESYDSFNGPGEQGYAVGDFNGDKISDLVATAAVISPGSTSVLIAQGPAFSRGILIDRPFSPPGHVAAADFNGDGKLDLLYGGGANRIPGGGPRFATILLGNGDLTFQPRIFLQLPHASTFGTAYTAIADINHDQKPDVLVADTVTNTLSIFLNDGSGTFPQTAPDFTTDLPQFVVQLQTADFNGDGVPDIIVTNHQNQNVSIFLSQTSPTLSLTSSTPSAFAGSSVSLTVQATSASGVAPGGTVTLMDGTTSLGQQPLDTNGVASFSLSNLAAGQHSLTASYSGDTNFTPATSPALTQTMNDFQVGLPTASQTLTAGGAATYKLAVTPTAGLTGSVTVTCSQLPSLSTCDPLTVPIDGQPVTATLTVHTTAPVTHNSADIHAAALGLLSFTLLPFCRRRSLRILAVTIALSATIFTSGCSGSSSSPSKTPTVVSPGTPQGSTQFTITSNITLGSQTLTRTSTATLVVQ